MLQEFLAAHNDIKGAVVSCGRKTSSECEGTDANGKRSTNRANWTTEGKPRERTLRAAALRPTCGSRAPRALARGSEVKDTETTGTGHSWTR